MNWLMGIWLVLLGMIGFGVWSKITKWFELLILGGFGLMTGALAAGARSWSDVSLGTLWEAFFS
ncbi:hypothetical protein [Nonomuraea sp. NPDC003804]|uniref:hypothetical protein n=1 Tax=Nonomuraea sp. NPDC003804 TaxID=3154547 RepID=UPI0033A6A9DE